MLEISRFVFQAYCTIASQSKKCIIFLDNGGDSAVDWESIL